MIAKRKDFDISSKCVRCDISSDLARAITRSRSAPKRSVPCCKPECPPVISLLEVPATETIFVEYVNMPN